MATAPLSCATNDSVYFATWDKLMPPNQTEDEIEELTMKIETALYGMVKKPDHKKSVPFRYTFLGFNSLDVVLAYHYRFYTCVSFAVEQLWGEYHENCMNDDRRWQWGEKKTWFDEIFSKGKLRIFSLGECPGFGAAGFGQWAAKVQPKTELEIGVTMVDNSEEWVCQTTRLLLKTNLSASNNYVFDLNAVDVERTQHQIMSKKEVLDGVGSADLVCLVKYFSNHKNITDRTVPYLQTLLGRLKPNALIFFMDNIECGYLDKMHSVATDSEMRLLKTIDSKTVTLESNEVNKMAEFHFENEPIKEYTFCAGLWEKKN